MKIGCCTNMIATQADGTGVEYIEKLASLGFDYIELPLAEMTALSDSQFQALVDRVTASGLACEVCNNFFPKTMRLTGDHVDQVAIDAYVKRALSRAGRLGVEHVVFGSGPAKNVPEGFSMEAGYRQVVELLQRVAPVARAEGIVIVIEPLRKEECNLINSFAQGCQLAHDVGSETVRVLVDYYHLTQEQEPVQNLMDQGGEYLRHAHFARPAGRGFPASGAEHPGYQPFFNALKAAGYDRRMSLEAYTTDFETEAPAALQFFHQQMK